jgi:hypothetical protein
LEIVVWTRTAGLNNMQSEFRVYIILQVETSILYMHEFRFQYLDALKYDLDKMFFLEALVFLLRVLVHSLGSYMNILRISP